MTICQLLPPEHKNLALTWLPLQDLLQQQAHELLACDTGHEGDVHQMMEAWSGTLLELHHQLQQVEQQMLLRHEDETAALLVSKESAAASDLQVRCTSLVCHHSVRACLMELPHLVACNQFSPAPAAASSSLVLPNVCYRPPKQHTQPAPSSLLRCSTCAT